MAMRLPVFLLGCGLLAACNFPTNDGQTGNVVFKVGHNTYSVPVTKSKPTTSSSSSSSVNKLA